MLVTDICAFSKHIKLSNKEWTGAELNQVTANVLLQLFSYLDCVVVVVVVYMLLLLLFTF